MNTPTFDYEAMVHRAMRHGLVRDALRVVEKLGHMPDGHNFYIGFMTRFPGVDIPDFLLERWPEVMIIVLEHQFFDLVVGDDKFSVTLSFQGRHHRLTIPLDAVFRFADDNSHFLVQLPVAMPPAPVVQSAPREPAPADAVPVDGAGGDGKVVNLSAFRRKAG